MSIDNLEIAIKYSEEYGDKFVVCEPHYLGSIGHAKEVLERIKGEAK